LYTEFVILVDNEEVSNMEQPWKRLKDVASEMHISHEAARRAAIKGRIPSFQPFGKGTAWMVAPDYRKFLAKSSDQGRNQNGDKSPEPIKNG
jgi:hypothetical protein